MDANRIRAGPESAVARLRWDCTAYSCNPAGSGASSHTDSIVAHSNNSAFCCDGVPSATADWAGGGPDSRYVFATSRRFPADAAQGKLLDSCGGVRVWAMDLYAAIHGNASKRYGTSRRGTAVPDTPLPCYRF